MVVDGEPIRRAARQAHEKARAQLETIERQFAQFERQELPAYQRWMHLTFGPLITKLRETESAIESKEDILERVEAYQIWENMSPAHAYARVKSEMENPGRDSETEKEENDFDGLDDESEDFLRDAYEAASAAFKQESGFEAPISRVLRKQWASEANHPHTLRRKMIPRRRASRNCIER